MTVSAWPPPVHIRRVLRRAHRRLHTLRPEDRPSLRDPQSYVGLFPLWDLTALTKCGYWPLPAPALAWLDEPHAERVRREGHAEIIANTRQHGQHPAACEGDHGPALAPGKPAVIRGRRPGHSILRCRVEVY
jgi:hypothetical protein